MAWILTILDFSHVLCVLVFFLFLFSVCHVTELWAVSLGMDSYGGVIIDFSGSFPWAIQAKLAST